MNRPKKSYHCNKCGYIGDASEHSGCDYLACTSLDSQYADHLEAEVARLTAELAAANQGQRALQKLVSDTANERNQWQANHKNVVERLRLATQRNDLPVDRIPAMERMRELQEELAELREQKPVAYSDKDGQLWREQTEPDDKPLYARPVPAAQAVPEGWQLMPKDPTFEMLRDGEYMTNHNCDSRTIGQIYRAMLAAAPQPPADRVPAATKMIEPSEDTRRLITCLHDLIPDVEQYIRSLLAGDDAPDREDSIAQTVDCIDAKIERAKKAIEQAQSLPPESHWCAAGVEPCPCAVATLKDAAMLDWLDAQNQRKNDQNGTKYGWKFSENCNRIALEDHGFPPISVREAITAAMQKGGA